MIEVRIMLVLRHIYIVIKGVTALGGEKGIEVVGKAIVTIEVIVYILVIAKVYSLKAVSKASKISKV